MLPPAGDRQVPGGHIIGDGGSGGDVGPVGHLDRGDEGAVAADERVRADLRDGLPHPVVVRRDHARADVGPGADRGVPQVGQVVRLRPVADGRLLDLHECPDLRAGTDVRAGPQVGVGAHLRAGADMRVVAVRAQHGGVVIDGAVDQRRVGPDVAAGPDAGARLEVRAGQQLRVAADPHVGMEPGGGGVVDRHAVQLGLAHQAVVEPPCQPGELHPVVDAFGLLGVGGHDTAHPAAVADRDRDHIRQIALALRVGAADLLQRVGEQLPVEGVHTGVDLADREGGGIRIAVLDDGAHGAVAAAHDAAVAGGIVDPGGQDGDGVAGAGVFLGQPSQGLGAQQRHIPVGDDDRPGERAGPVERALHGVPGAELLGLQCRGQRHSGEVGGSGQEVLHLLAAVADDGDHLPRTERGGGADGVPEQRPAGQRVQHLRDRRAHAGALPGGEHDDGRDRGSGPVGG